MTPAALAARLDAVLHAAQTLLEALPPEVVAWRSAPDGPSVRDLGYRIFRRSLAFADGVDRGRWERAWAEEPAPPALDDGAAVARYGALVRGRLAGWFQGAGGEEYGQAVETDEGRRSGHELLALTLAGAARDLRRLHACATGLGVPAPTLPPGC